MMHARWNRPASGIPCLAETSLAANAANSRITVAIEYTVQPRWPGKAPLSTSTAAGSEKNTTNPATA